jgi:hypothetical protein
VSRHRRAARTREQQAVAEVGLYGALGSLVAAAVLVLAGHAWQLAALLPGGTALLVALLHVVARRTGPPPGVPAPRQGEPSRPAAGRTPAAVPSPAAHGRGPRTGTQAADGRSGP